MQNSIIKLYSLILFLNPSISFSQEISQAIVYGYVTDSTNKPIPFTQIIVLNALNSSINGFTQADNKGYYKLIIKAHGEYNLSFRALSYKEVNIPFKVVDDQNGNSYQINVILKESNVYLDQVVIKSKAPITVKSDTVVFKVSSFKRGNEQIAEDILKKLPGLDVSDNGAISWQGKEIEKIMIDGDDIFGRGYRLVSRNLHANVIDEVEVYERYSNNPLLKNIEESDRVAINLTLNENVRFTTFGNTSFGYSSIQSHSLRSNLMSFSKKQKLYLFGNSNSIGFDPIGDVKFFTSSHSISEQSKNADEFSDPQNIINLRGFNPDLKDQRVRDNNSYMISPSINLNFNEKLTAKIITFATLEKDDFFRWGYFKYNIADTSFTNNESDFLTKKNQNYFAKVEVIYHPSKRNLFEYRSEVLYSSDKSKSQLQFNESSILKNLNNSILNTSHNITYTNRISTSTALIVNGKYQYVKTPEKFKVLNLPPWDLFLNNDLIVGLSQQINNKLQNVWLEFKTISRIDDSYTLNIQVGGIYKNQYLVSDLYQIFENGNTSVIGSDFSNRFHYQDQCFYGGLNMMRKLGSISLNGSFNGYWHTLSLDQYSKNQSFSYIVPKLGLLWESLGRNRINLIYAYNASPNTLLDMTSGYLLTDNRSLNSGLGRFYIFRGHSSILNYKYGKGSDRFLFNCLIIYNNSRNNLTTDSYITPEYNLIKSVLGDNRKMLTSSFSGDLFIRPLRSNLKIRGSHSFIRFDNIVNNSSNTVALQYFSIGTEFRTAFVGILNFHTGINWIVSKVQSKSDNNSIDNNQFLDLFLLFNQAFWTKVNIERYCFGSIHSVDNPWLFIDISATYNYKPNKLSFSISANNLLNNKQFGNFNLNEVSESATIYRIIPRHIMFSTELRF